MRRRGVALLGDIVWAFRRLFIGDRLARLGRSGALDALPLVQLAVKGLGYEIARERTPHLRAIVPPDEPPSLPLRWKATTQRDLESPWFAYWCRELKIEPIYFRKLWEYGFVLQSLHHAGMIREGVRGLGFGCGEEPIASYLASKGARVTVTDLAPAQSRGRGWIERGYHTTSLSKAHKPELVDKATFDERVGLEFVDMNAIPSHLEGQFDFCWSVCAFEHLGSAEHGLRFVENAMATLRPGGIAIHTTEFNFLSEDRTVETPDLVLYQRRHLKALHDRLRRTGYLVPEVEFDTGDGVLDRFIDFSPYPWEPGWRDDLWGRWGLEVGNLKMAVGPVATTCFGIVAQKQA